MWRLLEYLVLAAVVMISITEFFYPLLTGKPLFGSFRKKVSAIKPNDEALDQKLQKAKEKIQDVRHDVINVQKEVDDHFKTAEELKEESDNLLNNNKNYD